MEIIGIICEYNPFHNGHTYHINKIKELYPDSLIILALNGYFLERGEVSILTKEEKTKIALENNIDLVVELPFVFGSQSADIFGEKSVLILSKLGVNKIVFGSESNDIAKLNSIAEIELNDSFNEKVKDYLNKGLNYPTALNKAIGISTDSPNDLLGISYIKAIKKNSLNIEPITIKRTNNYHDLLSNDIIVSASNIREKYKKGIDVSNYTNYQDGFKKIDEDLLFNLIKYKIISDDNLSKYLSVDEGIEYKLIKEINSVKSIEELILKVKSKRYTYNRIRRMLMHVLIGLTKEDMNKVKLNYIKVLGFNSKGQKYLNRIKSDILIQRKISDDYLEQKYELRASMIYDLISNCNSIEYELSNKPIKFDNE